MYTASLRIDLLAIHEFNHSPNNYWPLITNKILAQIYTARSRIHSPAAYEFN